MLSTALRTAPAVALFSVLAFSAGLAAAKAAIITSNLSPSESNAVGTATCQQPSILREGNSHDETAVPPKSTEQPPALRAPQPYCAVPTATG